MRDLLTFYVRTWREGWPIMILPPLFVAGAWIGSAGL